jgi:hypothetical protein
VKLNLLQIEKTIIFFLKDIIMRDILNAAKEAFPNQSDEVLLKLLWNVTCYPFGTKEQVMTHFKEAGIAGNQDPESAIQWAHDKLHESMKEFNHANFLRADPSSTTSEVGDILRRSPEDRKPDL